MAAEGGRRTRGLHAGRISSKQRLHLAALLTLVVAAALPLQAQSNDDINFDPTITQAEFDKFSSLVAQAIYATPVEPAHGGGLLGFDIGIAATAVPIDPNATYWTRSVGNDFSISDHAVVPRLIASKGIASGTITAMLSKVPDTDIQVWGAAYDMPLTHGGIATPTLALRGSYSQLRGVDELDLKTYGVEVFLSKGFGPITPYAAAGYARHKSKAVIDAQFPDGPSRTLSDEGDMKRYTIGVKISLMIPRLVVEATQGDERSYAAKISFGF
jgi:hypothetical protein